MLDRVYSTSCIKVILYHSVKRSSHRVLTPRSFTWKFLGTASLGYCELKVDIGFLDLAFLNLNTGGTYFTVIHLVDPLRPFYI